jgi:hypothetical protein
MQTETAGRNGEMMVHSFMVCRPNQLIKFYIHSLLIKFVTRIASELICLIDILNNNWRRYYIGKET